MLGKKLDTQESREFWQVAKKVSEEVASWPEWKKADYGPNSRDEQLQSFKSALLSYMRAFEVKKS